MPFLSSQLLVASCCLTAPQSCAIFHKQHQPLAAAALQCWKENFGLKLLEDVAGKLHIWELDRQNNIQKSITHKVGLLPVLYLHDFQVTKNW